MNPAWEVIAEGLRLSIGDWKRNRKLDKVVAVDRLPAFISSLDSRANTASINRFPPGPGLKGALYVLNISGQLRTKADDVETATLYVERGSEAEKAVREVLDVLDKIRPRESLKNG